MNLLRLVAFLYAALLLPAMTRAQGTADDYARAARLAETTRNKVVRASVTPRWISGGPNFWYRNDLAGGQKEFVLVEPAQGRVRRFPDDAALRAAAGAELAETVLKALPRPPAQRDGGEESAIVFVNQTSSPVNLFWAPTPTDRRPYGTLAPGARREQHTFAGHVWVVTDANGKLLAAFRADDLPAQAVVDGVPPTPDRPTPRPDTSRSPDGKWRALVRNHNVVLRPTDGGEEVVLTADGSADDRYDPSTLSWSPDSVRLVVFRTIPPQSHPVHIVESTPKEQLQPRLKTIEYLKPGDRIAHPRPVLIDIGSRQARVIPDTLFPNPWSLTRLGRDPWPDGVTWDADSSGFWFVYNERGHQRMRVLRVDARSGDVAAIVDEASRTFIDYADKFLAELLPETGELLWMSERDGWNHVYLYDARTGRLKNPVTRGAWLVREVEKVDPQTRQVWFRALGIRPGQDPYQVHHARVNLDGSGLTVLTEGDGTHRVTASPDGAYLVDTFSRVDLPPVTELRRADTGARIAVLETADDRALRATGWRRPERFVAKGRDGKTDIWGVIWRPTNFDGRKKWPVIEQIYAGPQGHFVPKVWSSFYGNAQQIAELGFVVVQIDGMGTNWREKSFHDVCWRNLKDAGFPDRIAWLKAVAQKYPYLDLNRVGIYGGSAGGQNALAALIWHGDFYKAAVADCGCHDNRMDKIWWNELWMGWPIGKHYEESSNTVNAGRVTGNLMLVVGELDTNVDPASTMQVAAALVKADRDFDLLVVPGAGHGACETPYGKRRRMDFFVRHLLGVMPRLPSKPVPGGAGK